MLKMGKAFIFGKDRWIPSLLNFKIIIPTICPIQKIYELIHLDFKCWNLSLIENPILPNDSASILRILIGFQIFQINSSSIWRREGFLLSNQLIWLIFQISLKPPLRFSLVVNFEVFLFCIRSNILFERLAKVL